jgi:hypothetical protein
LTITLPDGWSSHGASTDELDLIPSAPPDDVIFMWTNVVAIESNGETPKILSGVAPTANGLTASFQKSADLVVSTPTDTTVAGDIAALTYVIGVSPSAAYTSRGCPSYPTCANILKDPRTGPGEFYAIGAPEVVRLYLATVGTGTSATLFVIGLNAPNEAELTHFTDVAAPIIASIRLPAGCCR